MPSKPLSAALDQIHDQLADIRIGITNVQGQAAEIAETVRRVQRVVSSEITDCPRLFTLEETRVAGIRQARFYQRHYRLTLWCEHPEYWHPWKPATYDLNPPKEWLAKVGPYMALVFRALQLIVPLAGSIAVTLLPQEQMAEAQARLQVMTTLVADLPGDMECKPGGGNVDQAADRLSTIEGQGLPALRAILFEHDELRAFGGMRRVQASSGDLMWVCPDHYREYDPGLPIVP